MKKIFAILSFMAVSFAANAQNDFNPFLDKELFQEMLRSVVVLILLYLFTTFILSLIRVRLDNRLKKAILEKQTPENIIAQLLPKNKNEQFGAIKWFSVLTAIGIGLLVVSLFQPLGFHSVIIMVFSVAIGFLGYYFFIRGLNN